MRIVSSRSGFYKLPFGALGLIPRSSSVEHAKASAGEYWVLPSEKQCNVRCSTSSLIFQFNHRVDVEEAKRTHIGVLVVSESRGGSVAAVEHYRNAQWHRSPGEIFSESALRSPVLSWEKFVETIPSTVPDSDKVVGFKWHATPIGGDKDSWDYHQFWGWAVKNYQKFCKGSDDDLTAYKVSARLIAYAPTTKKNSSNPVLFNVNRGLSAENIFIAVYSITDSGVESQNFYALRVSRP